MAENDLSMSNMNVRMVTQELKQDSGTVQITINPFQTDGEDMHEEPPLKKQRVQFLSDASSPSVKQQLFTINRAICLRLDSIESKLNNVLEKTRDLESKMDLLMSQAASGSPPDHGGMINGPVVGHSSLHISSDGSLSSGRHSGNLVVGVPQAHSPGSVDIISPGTSMDEIEKERYAIVAPGTSDASVHKLYQEGSKGMSQNITLITLNSEEDYPNGSWLGDDTNTEMRVRVPITSSDLLHIHSNCRTAEKMALTLLDYLFDRETQASSNLSGMGKHGKKQLDPLLIYGIRCHLIKRFNMTEQDWHRIKQNVDSKCRTAFRRKQRGLPLTVKAFRGKAPAVMNTMLSGYPQLHDLSSHSDDSLQHEDAEIQLTQVEHLDTVHDGMVMAPLTQINSNGEIQVLHATPEQVAQLQQTHQIQILQGDQVIGHLGGNSIASDIQVTVSLPSSESEAAALHVISNSNQHSSPPPSLSYGVDDEHDQMGIKREPDVSGE